MEVGVWKFESGKLGLGLKLVKKFGLWGFEIGFGGMEGVEMGVFRVVRCVE